MPENETLQDVETYLANVPDPARGMLERIRIIVRRLAPDAREVIAYGIPTFKLHGNLVHYAAFKNHCSFFPGSARVNAELKDELARYKVSKGTIQFTADNPLSDDLVERIVLLRLDEDREAAALKRKAKAK
jgi:uncharacterized protein YdhG (YjbR/CyaY superfamily)